MKSNLVNEYQKVFITNDHTGIKLKQHIIKFLSKYYEVIDLGTNEFNKSVDYPDYGFKLAEYVSQNSSYLGIAICGSGNGINISCNKMKSIRSAILYNTKSAIYAKKHNNTNIIVFSANFNKISNNIKYLKKFLNSEFEGNRHQRRIDKISEFELKTKN